MKFCNVTVANKTCLSLPLTAPRQFLYCNLLKIGHEHCKILNIGKVKVKAKVKVFQGRSFVRGDIKALIFSFRKYM